MKKSVAEAVGAFAMVFTGCGALMVQDRFPGSIAPGSVPMIFGLIVATMIYAVGHISGAHFNPAVSLAFALSRHFPPKHLAAYWLAQVAGAVAASALLWATLPEGSEFGATHPRIPAAAALVWEGVMTFLLMFVIISVATDTRAVGTMAGAAIGSTVAIAAFVAGPLTGASMNPARSLAPALFDGRFFDLWIYVVGPVVGAVAAATLYSWLRADSDKVLKACDE